MVLRSENIQAASQSRSELVSIGLPVRNGAGTLADVVKSVLAQDYEHLELVISDNASTDVTEELCRELAATDSRIVYHRQPQNIGLLGNFSQTVHLARGTFFRWLGDDDWIAPNYISRCMDSFVSDSRLVLVTTQLTYVRPDGSDFTLEYAGKAFYSDDPIERLEELITLIIRGNVPVDPLYGMARRACLAAIPRRNMIREDEVFATRLTLAGPWAHLPEVLARRDLRDYGVATTARYLGVPMWQARVPTAVQCWEMLRFLRDEKMTNSQRRQAKVAVGRLFVGRHYATLKRRSKRLVELLLPLTK